MIEVGWQPDSQFAPFSHFEAVWLFFAVHLSKKILLVLCYKAEIQSKILVAHMRILSFYEDMSHFLCT